MIKTPAYKLSVQNICTTVRKYAQYIIYVKQLLVKAGK